MDQGRGRAQNPTGTPPRAPGRCGIVALEVKTCERGWEEVVTDRFHAGGQGGQGEKRLPGRRSKPPGAIIILTDVQEVMNTSNPPGRTSVS